MSDYKTKFQEALLRSEKYGLRIPKIRYSNDVFISEYEKQKLPHLYDLSANKLVAQCMQIHYGIKPKLEQECDCDIYFTIGYVERDGLQLFKFDENDINIWINDGFKLVRKIHCWLTLPTMEIVDLTMETSLANATENKYGRSGDFIMGKADLLPVEYGIYCPMIIGEDFLRKIGSMIEF